MEGMLESDTGVRQVSEYHPRYQAYGWVKHHSFEGGVIKGLGPRRFTRAGARKDLPLLIEGLLFQIRKAQRARA
jgi:hypothetical protein